MKCNRAFAGKRVLGWRIKYDGTSLLRPPLFCPETKRPYIFLNIKKPR